MTTLAQRLGLCATICFATVSTAGTIIHVDGNATGPTHDGTSWCQAYLNLSDALAAATPGSTVRMADGTYVPDPTGLSDAREATFAVPADVIVEGGYAGCGASNPDDRDAAIYETILSGDINGDDGPNFANNGDNAYHVVTINGGSPAAMIDLLTITAANATGSELFGHHAGGAVRCQSSANIRQCRLINNHADRGGAAILVEGGSTVVERTIMTGNVSEFEGGAILVWSSPITLNNCLLADNHAITDSGGAISTDLAQANIINTTCVNNTAGNRGGGAFNYVGTKMTVTNSIFHGNSANDGSVEDQQITVQASNILFINHSYMQGWTGQYMGDANSGDDPMFVNGPSGDYRLAANSPYINAGDNEAVTLTLDLEGNPRIADGTVDLGPYEFQASAVPAISPMSVVLATIIMLVTGSVVTRNRSITGCSTHRR